VKSSVVDVDAAKVLRYSLAVSTLIRELPVLEMENANLELRECTSQSGTVYSWVSRVSSENSSDNGPS